MDSLKHHFYPGEGGGLWDCTHSLLLNMIIVSILTKILLYKDIGKEPVAVLGFFERSDEEFL